MRALADPDRPAAPAPPEWQPILPADVAPQVVATRSGGIECATLGDGPAVLCLHGAMGGWDQGVLLARTAGSPGFRYVAPSRPGYLGTPLPVGGTLAAQARAYRDLLDALGIERAAIMAVSGGGPSALQLALEHPDRCWGLVVISSICRRVERRLPLAWHVLRLAARFPPLAAAMRRAAGRHPDAATRRSIPDPELRARTLADPAAGPLLRAIERSTLDRMAERMPGAESDVAVTRRRDLAFPLEDLRTPLLVVHGTEDDVAPFDHGREMASRVPGAELLAVEGGRHVTIFTHRELVRSRVSRFLSAHAPRVITAETAPA